MKHYIVISEEMQDGGWGYEPPEYYRCVVCVDAKTKREARLKAYKHIDMREWVKEARDHNENPFVGMKVEEAEKCSHGLNVCCGECEKCLDEAYAAINARIV